MYVLPWKNWIIGDFRGETPHFGEWAGAKHPPTPQMRTIPREILENQNLKSKF